MRYSMLRARLCRRLSHNVIGRLISLSERTINARRSRQPMPRCAIIEGLVVEADVCHIKSSRAARAIAMPRIAMRDGIRLRMRFKRGRLLC